MRRSINHACTVLFGFLFVFMAITESGKAVLADVNVGDVIDATNCQKIKGVVPDPVYEYIQRGWISMKIARLNFDPGDILCAEYRESLTRNLGKYSMNSKGEIIENASGRVDPYDIIGIPFPVIDVKDPQAGVMMLQNHVASYQSRGDMKMTSTLYFVGQKMERYIRGPARTISLTGTAKNISRQKEAAQFGNQFAGAFVMKVTDPFELNGLATMSYYYFSNQADKVYSYVPALRRVRSLNASSRSDAMFGTDFSVDDGSGGFGGKPRDFICKYLRTQNTLMRFSVTDIIDMVKRPDGSYELKKTYTNVRWGFDTPGWKGKPWATTNDIWTSRNVHVIECQAKDPYYNYGKFELWYDPKTFNFAYKVIWDRAGKRWKVMNSGSGCYLSKDGVLGKCDVAFGDWIYDEQRDHATSIDEYNTRETKLFTSLQLDEFTSAGLTKFSK